MGKKQPAVSGPISVSVADLLRLWNTDLTMQEIAADLQIDIEQVVAAAKANKLKYKKRGTPPEPELTEEEILQRAAEIRKGWSAEETLKRIAEKSPRARFYQYRYSSNTGIFTYEGHT